jgi:anaerobic selenocysteine-containing dehydrogenase
MTAAKADLWLPCNPGTEAVVASALQAALRTPGVSVTEAAGASGLTEVQILGVADEMRRAGTRTVAVPGNGLLNSANAAEAFTEVEALNAQVKSQCVGFGTAAISAPKNWGGGASGFRNIQQLIQQMQAGQISSLLILGQPNPVFTLPTATGFTEALAKVAFTAALTPFEDETTAYADVVLPTRSFLEDWGDHVPPVIPPGTRLATLRQPIIDPHFIGGNGQVQDNTKIHQPWMDTRPLGDLLIDLAKSLGKPMTDTDSRAAVRKTWAAIWQANLAADTTENDTKWVEALSNGGVWTTGQAKLVGALLAAPSGLAAPSPAPASPAPAMPAPNSGGTSYALHLYPNIYNHDGRLANLGWMQENPDPMTMAVWNSWVEINMQVAHSLGIRTGDIVRLTTAHGSIEVPAVPYPGLHPGAVAMPIGQGHTVYGRNAAGRGTNPLAILDPTADVTTGALAYGASRVILKKIADAQIGYDPHGTTLVLAQDRPGGQEPEVLKDLIHTTAKEWKAAHTAPKSE